MCWCFIHYWGKERSGTVNVRHIHASDYVLAYSMQYNPSREAIRFSAGKDFMNPTCPLPRLQLPATYPYHKKD